MKQSYFLRTLHMSSRRYSIILMAALLAIALISSVFFFVPAAHAGTFTHAVVPYGTNGQQLEVRTLAASVNVNGYNQNGDPVHHCFDTPDYDTYLSGWWWKGNMQIWSYNGTGCTDPTNDVTFVYVPTKFYEDFYPVRVLPWE